jgi:transcriptional antiterminator
MAKVTLIDEASFQELIQKIEEIDRKVSKMKTENPAHRWLTNKDVSEMLSVTERTLQNYRDKGILPFSQVGTKIYYLESDIELFLQNHYQSINNKTERRIKC